MSNTFSIDHGFRACADGWPRGILLGMNSAMSPFPSGFAKLGFGLMRLPRKDGAIDLSQVSKMTDRFLESGCAYFDTAYVYDGSEEAARKVLVERHPRESFLLATKLAAWVGYETHPQAIAQFETSLARVFSVSQPQRQLHGGNKQHTTIPFERQFETLRIISNGIILQNGI